ncbi:SUKH-4 family immunity protein [Flavobacterium sp. UBA4854]|uniref:SUKH-4 family immunity protein n=1 Tax=Flavobacterium sp. UBA4854 TaxID=1946548 RepID=UPI00257EBAFA|nr:SUKH-4 family immunity protein [Flavobacterium sp. UBA4854]
MEPIINKTKDRFIKIAESEIENNPLISDMFDKIKLLDPYYNTALEFYLNELYWLNLDEGNFVVFGHDLDGYFVMDKRDAEILQITEFENSFRICFCNSDIDKFICFNNLFINWVMKRISNEITKDVIEVYSETLQKVLKNIDDKAFSDENYFWIEPLYEISEDFFPLGDARIKLIEKLRNTPDLNF